MNRNELGTNVDVDSDIRSMQGGGELRPPDTSPQSLMERFQRQQQVETFKQAEELKNLESTLEHKLNKSSVTVTDIKFESPVTNVVPQAAVDRFINESPKPISNSGSLRDRINEMESKLGITDYMPGNSKSYSAQSYLDDLGEETFYVQNVSNGHVLVTDLDLKITRGKTLDLLKFCDLEAIKKSKDMRIALSSSERSGAMLVRLTPQQYLSKIEQAYTENTKIEQFKRLNQLRAATGQTPENKYNEPIRPLVYDKLNKLKLSYSDTPHKGITPVEFAQWVQTENLTKAELDQILAHVDDNELRILVNERKKVLLERM